MTVVSSVSELAGELVSRARFSARVAVEPGDLAVLTAAYSEHLTAVARAGLSRGCEHVAAPPYIVVSGQEGRGWCAGCVAEVLPARAPRCGICLNAARLVMFPFGDLLVAGHVCVEHGPKGSLLYEPGDRPDARQNG
jgi:hypothetical protein